MIGNNAIVLSKEEVGALNEAGEQGRYSVEVSLRLKQELYADRLTSESATKPLFDLLGMLKQGDYVQLSHDEHEAVQKLLMAQPSDLQSRLISALPNLTDALLFQWLEKQMAYAHLPGSVQRELMAVMPRIQSERHQRLAGMAEE
jgi:hypothetical protein